MTPIVTIVPTLTMASTVTMYDDTVYGNVSAATIDNAQPSICTSSNLSMDGMRCGLDRKLRANCSPKSAADARPTGGDTVFHQVHCGHRNCTPKPVSAACPKPMPATN